MIRCSQRWAATGTIFRELEVECHPSKRRCDIKKEIGDLVAAEFPDASLFVIKDPRICRFSPLFIDALSDEGIVLRIVHIIRNPLEVAASLERRNGMAQTDAALLWLRHVLDSEAATRSCSRVIVSYAALLRNWRATLESLNEGLQVFGPHVTDDLAEQVSQLLDSAHRHHIYTIEDVLADSTLRDWVGEVYAAMLVLEQDSGSRTAMARLDVIRQEFNRTAPILHRLQEDEKIALKEGTR